MNTIYTFYINQWNLEDQVVHWIKSKIAKKIVKDVDGEKFAKTIFPVSSTIKERVEDMRLFLINHGCTVSDITSYKTQFNNDTSSF